MARRSSSLPRTRAARSSTRCPLRGGEAREVGALSSGYDRRARCGWRARHAGAWSGRGTARSTRRRWWRSTLDPVRASCSPDSTPIAPRRSIGSRCRISGSPARAARASTASSRCRPDSIRPAEYPLFVLLHGGPHSMWIDQFVIRWNYHLLAQPGYVVLLTNYTGSTGYGEKFAQNIQGIRSRGRRTRSIRPQTRPSSVSASSTGHGRWPAARATAVTSRTGWP